MPAVQQPGIELVWNEVADRLHKTLLGRGVSHELAEDVIQETAVRVMERHVGFTDANDLFRWSSVVARHLAIDAARREARRCDLPAEMESTVDVADEAIGRWWFDAVRRGLQQLSDTERAAILTPGAADDRQGAVRLAVRRHRARRHLLLIAQSLGIASAWSTHRVRQTLRGAGGVMATVSAAIVLMVATQPHGPSPSAPPVAVPLRAAAPAEPRQGTSGAPPVAMGAPARVSIPAVLSGAVAPRSTVPSIRVPVESPTGSGDVGVRPKGPDDALACVTVTPVGRQCVGLPVDVTT